MTKLDYYWASNEKWYHLNENMCFVVNDDAPEEAKKSYREYKEQIRKKSKNGSL